MIPDLPLIGTILEQLSANTSIASYYRKMKLLNYEPTSQSVWQGRKDSLPGERFFQHVELLDLGHQTLTRGPSATLFLGFCSDEGILRNEGRIGAKTGPYKLREQLGKLACHTSKHFIDIGNIVCEKNLESAQEQFATMIYHSHQQGYKTVAFGGGHDIAFGHFCGLSAHYPKLGIINFDAHFDLRPINAGASTSGTPFRQIADYCLQHHLEFDYCCLGIQPIANTKGLFDTAKALNVSYLSAEQINEDPFSSQCAFLDKFMKTHDYLYLSLCLDVFAECFAPGVSAPQAMGLTPSQTLPLLKYILQTGKVISLDVAELSPPLDEEQKTTRLAASLVAAMLDYL